MKDEGGWHLAQPPRRSRIVTGGKEGRKKRRSCVASPLGMSRDIWFDSVYHLSCPHVR